MRWQCVELTVWWVDRMTSLWCDELTGSLDLSTPPHWTTAFVYTCSATDWWHAGYSAAGRGIKYCNEYICPLAYLTSHTSILSVHVNLWLWLGPPLMTVQYVLRRWHHILFSHKSAYFAFVIVTASLNCIWGNVCYPWLPCLIFGVAADRCSK